MALVLGANKLLTMAKDISALCPIVVNEVFFQLISHSIVLQLWGLFWEHLFISCGNTSFLLIFFGLFQYESYASMWGHYGSRIVGVFLRPSNKALGLITDILRWYRVFFMEDCAPSAFLWS